MRKRKNNSINLFKYEIKGKIRCFALRTYTSNKLIHVETAKISFNEYERFKKQKRPYRKGDDLNWIKNEELTKQERERVS